MPWALALGLLPCAPIQAAPGVPGWVIQARENLQVDRDPAEPAVLFSVGPDRDDPFSGMEQGGRDQDSVRAWQLQVLDSDLSKVAYVQGRGAPPEGGIPWYGLSPDGGLLRDGFYKARFVWRDEGGDHSTTPVDFSLLTVGPMRAFLGPEVSLDYSPQGLIIRIREGLMFSPGQWDIQPRSEKTLAQIADFLRDHPRNSVVIQGYTDTTGGAQANALVSQRRAKAVFDYFVQSGLDPGQARYEGRGSAAPIAPNATAQGRAKNRRVEILVLKQT